MNITLQSVRLAGEAGDAQLIYAGGMMIALALHLVGDHYGDYEDQWNVEACFGSFSDLQSAPFANLTEAIAWARAQIGATS